ncbi:MAG: homocysteine S-methyltransferase family protein [Pseudomonadota bacterium]
MPRTEAYARAEERLHAGHVLVLDAGVATELERRGVGMGEGVWSARAAVDQFETVVATHCAYADAGADIITANTYASSRIVLERYGIGDQTRDINTRSLDAALTARERTGRSDLLVAGSLSHFVGIPAGQSIQAKDDPVTDAEMSDAFNEMRELFEAAGVDVILLEMMSLPQRMRHVFAAIEVGTTPTWCGFSVLQDMASGRLTARHDTDLDFAEIVGLGVQADFPVLGVMHTAADATSPALAAIRAQADGPMMAYPDSGTFKAPHWQFIDIMTPETLADFSARWISDGACIIGGCCGLGPEHTRAQRMLADAHNAAVVAAT